MAKEIVLTAAEFSALGALIDGDRREGAITAEIKKRLSDLRLIERREWPNGPFWRTARGKRLVREGK